MPSDSRFDHPLHAKPLSEHGEVLAAKGAAHA